MEHVDVRQLRHLIDRLACDGTPPSSSIEVAIAECSAIVGRSFPPILREWFRYMPGGYPRLNIAIGEGPQKGEATGIDYFLRCEDGETVGGAVGGMTVPELLQDMYQTDEYGSDFDGLVPIARDPGAEPICVDISTDSCPVYLYWVFDGRDMKRTLLANSLLGFAASCTDVEPND
jgi:hypothetical protein